MAQQMPSALAPMIPGATPSGAGPSQPGSPDADSGPDSQSPSQIVVTITDNGDGTYSVSCDDGSDDDQGSGDQDPGQQPQTAKGIPAALKLAAQMLQSGGDPSAAWNAEASKRDSSGMPTPGAGTAPPSMSM
jgi:hypothetical protein